MFVAFGCTGANCSGAFTARLTEASGNYIFGRFLALYDPTDPDAINGVVALQGSSTPTPINGWVTSLASAAASPEVWALSAA